jgi:hypothetical protein
MEDETTEESVAAELIAELTSRAVGAPPPARMLDEGDVATRIQNRFTAEREARRRVLTAKLAEANRDFTGVRFVALSRDEIDAIRTAVDIQWPFDSDDRPYLDDEEDVSLTGDGEHFGGPVPDSIVEAGRHRRDQPVSDDAATAAAHNRPSGAPEALVPTTPPATEQPTPDAAMAPTPIHPAIPSPYEGAERAAAAVDEMGDLDVDALFRRLWVRIRRELRTELLIDRERAGALADFR